MPTPQHLARLGCSFWGSGESPLLRWRCSRTAVSWHNRHSADFKTIIRCSPLQVCTICQLRSIAGPHRAEGAPQLPAGTNRVRTPGSATGGGSARPGPTAGRWQRRAATDRGRQCGYGTGPGRTHRAPTAAGRQLLEAGLLLKSCFQTSAERRTLAITRPA